MITKEQLKDIGWALSVLRGLDRLGFAGEDVGPRLESATAGFKALAVKPTCSNCGTTDVEHVTICSNSDCQDYAAGVTTYRGWETK